MMLKVKSQTVFTIDTTFHFIGKFIYLVFVYVWACACHRAGVEVGGQLIGVCSLLPPCESCGSNSSCQV